MREALRKARCEAGYTQAELAHKIGIGQQSISKHETGVATPAHFKTLRQYEKVLGIKASDLFPDIFEE